MITGRGKLAAAAVVLAVALMTGGFLLGRATSQPAEWHSGTAYLLGDPENPGFSATVDGWTYGAEGSVPQWMDKSGSIHDGGWPACLRPPSLESSRDRRVPVRFAEVAVSANDVSWRPVVMVDCRR
jgi:hypothetical protein